MRRSIFSCFKPCVGTDENKRSVWFFCYLLPRLIADCMQTGGNMPKRSNECSIRRADTNMMSISGNATKDACYGVFTNTADG